MPDESQKNTEVPEPAKKTDLAVPTSSCVDLVSTSGMAAEIPGEQDRATPLHVAATNGHVKVVDCLIAVRCNIDQPAKVSTTA
eukprot:2254848-Rhodomonas_salina.1